MNRKLTKGYVGWLLPQEERSRLLEMIPPRYVQVVAHHCTLKFGVASNTVLPVATQASVVGVADDLQGVQALVLNVQGTHREDGKHLHITWSLAQGRRPVESNDVLDEYGFVPLRQPITIGLEPKFFPFGGKV
jgi:hypothetical protein